MTNSVLSFAGWLARRLPLPVKRSLYNIKPLAGFIRGTLNRAAPQGLSTVTVAAGVLEGCQLVLDLQTEKDYWLGTYEPELQAAINEWVQPGMLAYDVGANIGYISLMLARRVGGSGSVFAFEALPANLERLRVNLAINNLAERVIVMPGAVVDEEHPVRFWVGPSGGMGKAEGSAGRQEAFYSEAIEAKGISLDGFVYRQGNPPPQIVKMDIEGGEVLALPGMQRLLIETPPLVFLELHGPEAARQAWESLVGAGYRICRMQPGYPEVPTFVSLDWKAYLVAFPPEPVQPQADGKAGASNWDSWRSGLIHE